MTSALIKLFTFSLLKVQIDEQDLHSETRHQPADTMSNARSSPLCSLPSASAMFEMGPPCLQTLHAAIEDIDRQLSENDKSIEDTLRCLVQATNSLSADNDYTNIKDAMDSLLHTPVLEECACLSPEPEDVGILLRTILQHLTTHPGCELTTFRQLLHLSSHEGLGLPIRAPEPDHMTQSAMSLNTVADAADESNDLLWEDIRSRLRRFFFEQLQQLPIRPRDAGVLDLQGKQRVEYLQSLCILYPVRKVWSSYQLLRSQQVSTLIQDVMTPVLNDESITEAAEPKPAATLDQLAIRLPKLVECLEGMIEADFTVMLANVFDGQVEAAQALREIYLCSLSEELQTLLEKAWQVKSQQAKAEKKKPGKRMMGSVVGSSLFGDEDEMEEDMEDSEGVEVDISVEDVPPLTQDELVHLVTITEQLSGMDAYIHALHQQASRDSSAMLKPGRPKGSIKSALKHTRDPSSRDTSHRGEYMGRRGVLPDAIPPPFGVTPGMMTPETTAQRRLHILDSPASQIKWEWSSIMEGVISDVCTSLPSLVKNVCQAALQQEEMMHTQTQTVHMVPVCGDLVNSFSEYPRSVSKSLIDLVSFLDTILPLAINGAEGVMKPLRAAYVEAVIASMGHYFRKISNIFGAVPNPSKSSYPNIVEKYKLLSIASFAASHLTYYGDALGDDESRYSLGTVKKQYSELVASLKSQILDYQDHVISTVILQDAESHHWADQRPFYEDERCSFSVQMWHLHLDAFRQELFSICPPGLAQEIFGEVVNRSLALLAQRYNRAKPSYKRTRQYRADITALLLITLDHLWYLCPSPGPLLDPLSAHHPISPIHNSCTCLLSALAVVGSPLEDLYRVYRKGFSQRKAGGGMERTISEQEAVEGSSGLLSLAMSSSREWLRWLRPGLFDGLQKGMDNLPDKQAVFIQLKLLCSQPCPKYPLLLQALLMRNCLVPTLMVTNTGPTQSQTSRLNSLTAYDGCSGGICPGKPCHSYQSQDIPYVVQPIVDLLALCGDQPNALTTVLMAMIEKENNWECFEASCLPGKTLPVPLWLASVYKLISSYIDRAIKPSLAVLLKAPIDPKHQVGFIDSIKELPCGCRLKQKAQIIRATGPQEDILTAMQILISCLADNVGALPTPLCVFFNSLQQHLNEKEVHCTHDCIGLQVIASCLYNRLCDQEMLFELAGLPIGSPTHDQISQFGDYCYQVLTSSTAKCRDSLPPPVYTFMGCHTDWLHSRIDTIISHMDNELFVNCSGYPLEEAPSEFLGHYRQMQASLILQAPEGEKYLLQVYNMLTNNLDWFEHQLEIPPVFPAKDSSSPTDPKESPIFSLDLTKGPANSHTHSQPFQPLACFNVLNGTQFDQTALADFPFNWLRLLQCELGMSEVGFRTLLSRRHEMQEDVYLEEAEKKPVHILRSKYNLEVAELV